ncbi:MAG: hypothetical protein ACD_48C00385G0002 [uncultured bacterium]|nr:MAG: hypothetical protein ACD_48C00385G0002 [uncultured bacterium]
MRKKQVFEIADRVVGTATDIALIWLYSLVAVMGAGSKSTIKIHRAFDEAQKWHDQYNYDTIKQALQQLSRRKLIARKKYSRTDLAITTLGWERISQLVPVYHEKRPWDGHLYLISYDIPTSKNTSRDMLRTYIKKSGGALLQDSLWINPYNPTKLIDTYVSERSISGTVLISKIGKDGAIGDETLSTLLARVYNLDALSQRYNEFIDMYSKKSCHPFEGIQTYLSILRDDPQLPFPLLPKQFPDKTAYTLFQNLQRRLIKK